MTKQSNIQIDNEVHVKEDTTVNYTDSLEKEIAIDDIRSLKVNIEQIQERVNLVVARKEKEGTRIRRKNVLKQLNKKMILFKEFQSENWELQLARYKMVKALLVGP